MKKSKKIQFIVNGKTVEEIDGDEITFNEVETTKTCLAYMHGVTYDEVEVVADDIDKQDLSPTLFVVEGMGLAYKANSYAIFRAVNCPVVNTQYDFRKQEDIDSFLDGLSLYLKQKDSKGFDDFIIFL